MWKNSSAYSRVRFEDIAPKYHKALNKPKHQQTSKFQRQLTTLTKRQQSQAD